MLSIHDGAHGRRLAVLIAVLMVVALLMVGCSTSSSSDKSSSQAAEERTTVNVSSLKGPTSIGLVRFMADAKASPADFSCDYNFTIAGTVDEILPSIVQGTCDIALVPANVASVLYNKTDGMVSVIDINTLGVLYVVTGDTSITSLSNLAGHTIYMTGKGTTPEYVMDYLLAQNGLTDSVALEYKSEASEVVAALVADPSAVGVLPQPYATAACMQSPGLIASISLTDEWDKVQGTSGGKLVTGVTIVRDEFLDEHPEAVEEFLGEQSASVEYVKANPADAAALVVSEGIIEKAPVAEKAIPKCNLVCMTGDEMKDALEGYLTVLYNRDATSIGGALPGDDFYYLGAGEG